MPQGDDALVTRAELLEILEDYSTRDELARLARRGATTEVNDALLRALVKVLGAQGLLDETALAAEFRVAASDLGLDVGSSD